MRLHRFFLTVALAVALVPGPGAYADVNYRVEITGAEDSELADLLDSVSELKTLEDKVPASEEALRRRADRDLGRLADAAHSLGYWDAGFSYYVNEGRIHSQRGQIYDASKIEETRRALI